MEDYSKSIIIPDIKDETKNITNLISDIVQPERKKIIFDIAKKIDEDSKKEG